MKKLKPKSKRPKNRTKYLGEKLFDSLTKVRFKIGDRKFELDMGAEVIVSSDEDAHTQVEKLPGIMGYFGGVVGILEAEANNMKAIRKKTEALIDEDIRRTGLTGEQRIIMAVRRDPRWLNACLKVNKAEGNFRRAKNIYTSLMIKGNALESRSADIRKTPSDSLMGVSRRDVISLEGDDD